MELHCCEYYVTPSTRSYTQLADQLYQSMTKRFGKDPQVWTQYGEFLMRREKRQAARGLLQRSLKSLARKQDRKLLAFHDTTIVIPVLPCIHLWLGNFVNPRCVHGRPRVIVVCLFVCYSLHVAFIRGTYYYHTITCSHVKPYLFSWEDYELICWLYCEPTPVPHCMSAWCLPCITPGLFWLCWDPILTVQDSQCMSGALFV